MGRAASHCPATINCCWGPLCPFRQLRNKPIYRGPAPTPPDLLPTTDALVLQAQALIRGTMRLDTPIRGPRPILIEPLVEFVSLPERLDHSLHAGRTIAGCESCYNRIYKRKYYARAKANRAAKLLAYNHGLPNWEVTEAAHPDDRSRLMKELDALKAATLRYNLTGAYVPPPQDPDDDSNR